MVVEAVEIAVPDRPQPKSAFSITSVVALLVIVAAVVPAAFVTQDIIAKRIAPKVPYNCFATSLYKQPHLKAMHRKGLTLDDDTLTQCAHRMLSHWPNTWQEPVKYLRLFKAWTPEAREEDKYDVWKEIAKFVKKHDIQVLMGTSITCSEEEDKKDWEDVKELMKMIGPGNILGVGIGNEMELLYQKNISGVNMIECLDRMWNRGPTQHYFYNAFVDRLNDLEDENEMPGFDNVSVTTVMGGAAIREFGFQQDGDPARLTLFNDWVLDVFDFMGEEKWRKKWVYSVNIYPYFEPGFRCDNDNCTTCNGAIEAAIDFSSSGSFQNVVRLYRNSMSKVDQARMCPEGQPGCVVPANRSTTRLWVGETGWSSPLASTLKKQKSPTSTCDDWSSKDTFEQFYSAFLNWPMEEEDAPELTFYFTMRDSNNFGLREGFGLVETCDQALCKLQRNLSQQDFNATTEAPSWFAQLV